MPITPRVTSLISPAHCPLWSASASVCQLHSLACLLCSAMSDLNSPEKASSDISLSASLPQSWSDVPLIEDIAHRAKQRPRFQGPPSREPQLASGPRRSWGEAPVSRAAQEVLRKDACCKEWQEMLVLLFSQVSGLQHSLESSKYPETLVRKSLDPTLPAP